MPESKPSDPGVVVPKWLFGIVTSIGTVVVLALGGWVVNTWDNPAKLKAMEERVVSLEVAHTTEKLFQQAALGELNTTIKVMQGDMRRLAESNAELRPLILQAIR